MLIPRELRSARALTFKISTIVIPYHPKKHKHSSQTINLWPQTTFSKSLSNSSHNSRCFLLRTLSHKWTRPRQHPYLDKDSSMPLQYLQTYSNCNNPCISKLVRTSWTKSKGPLRSSSIKCSSQAWGIKACLKCSILTWISTSNSSTRLRNKGCLLSRRLPCQQCLKHTCLFYHQLSVLSPLQMPNRCDLNPHKWLLPIRPTHSMGCLIRTW